MLLDYAIYNQQYILIFTRYLNMVKDGCTKVDDAREWLTGEHLNKSVPLPFTFWGGNKTVQGFDPQPWQDFRSTNKFL